jgi:anti-sigma B factor antagonist
MIRGVSMDVKQRGLAGVIILDLTGRLILGDGEQLFREKVDELIERRYTRILVNLGGVSYIDSAGVGALVWKYVTVRRRGGALKLLNLQPRTHAVLSVTRLLTVLENFDSEMDAVLSFSQPPDGSAS